MDKKFMKIALELAKEAAKYGEVPVGAIVVDFSDEDCPQIIAKAYNQRETLQNPTAHAELLAIQEAAQKLETWRLTNCVVYVTLEPCIMCAGLMHQARIKKCVFGADDPKAGALTSLYSINKDERLNHNFEVVSGIFADQASKILKDFFKQRR